MPTPRPLARLALALALGLGTALVVSPTPAVACGGLFCARIPVDQAGERILFIQDDDTVIAHVQITYQGDAKDFSWVVPTPTQPTLAVGSDALFQTLRAATRPTFNLSLTTDGDCKPEPLREPMPGRVPSGAVTGGVSVVSQDQVGPFDTAILTADDPGALKKWLKDNNYVIPDKLDPLLDPYVAGKYYFVALKLTKDRSAGDIQPIVMKYKSPKPGIPIRLTGVAATPDMAVYVWVLGEKRAIPENYRHAIINEARIDWLNQGQNYAKVVTEAMNEAGGQAFVTDYAGKSSAIDTSAFATDQLKTDDLAEMTDPVAFYKAVRDRGFFNVPSVSPFGGPLGSSVDFKRMTGFFKRYIAKPDKDQNVDDQQFYSQVEYYADDLKAAQTTVNDAPKAAKELDDTIVQPYKDIRAQFAKHPYLTQLFTTMSPEEMTQDPTFRFNPDLPDVSNVHTATGVVKCNTQIEYSDAPVEITLNDGRKFFATRASGTGGKAIVMPAAARIEQLKPSGGASTIQDNSGVIAQALAAAGGSAISYDPSTGTPMAVPRAGGFGCMGCAATNAAPPPVRQGAGEGAAYGLLVLGWLGYRRSLRRR